MRYTTAALAALLPLTLAAPAAREDITVVWQHEKDTGSTSVQVWNTDESTLYGEQCGDTINTGKFANNPISFHVSPNGFGVLKYGSQIYYVHSLTEHSGGITCTKRYSDQHARVDCTVPAQETYQQAGVYGVWDKKECFTGESRQFGSILHHTNPSGGFLTHTSYSQNASSPSKLRTKTKRQDGVVLCDGYSYTDVVGDGNPHQNYYDMQLGDSNSCGQAVQCDAGAENSHSYTIGFSADISADGWISAGFSVEESWEAGTSQGCTGGPGETVCIWYNTAHTAYTVQNFDATTCDDSGTADGDPFVMYSPNQNNKGGGKYCVIGSCQYAGAAYWDKSGPAGGP